MRGLARSPHAWRRGASVAAFVAVPALVVALLVGAHSSSGPRINLGAGAAWLYSSDVGLLSLVDGASEEWAASVPVAALGGPERSTVSVVQSGADAYVVNLEQGTVTLVSGTTFGGWDRPVAFGEAGGSLVVAAGGSRVFVLDGSRGTASLLESGTLVPAVDGQIALRPGTGVESIVDVRGDVWVSGGGVPGISQVSVVDGAAVSRLHEGAGSGARLVLVRRQPVVVDVQGVGRLDDEGLADGWAECFGWSDRQLAGARLLGSAVSSTVYGVSSDSGTLVASGVGSGASCGASSEVGDPGDNFGPLVEAYGYVLVPNQTQRLTYPVESSTGVVLSPLDMNVQGDGLELVSRDSVIFYNDVTSESAGVIEFEGGAWSVGDEIAKYDPEHPLGDVQSTPPPASQTPTQSPSSTAPTGLPTSSTSGQASTPATMPTTPTTPSTPIDSSTETTTTTSGAPLVNDIAWSPDPPAAGEHLRFSANVENASGATWEWRLTDDDSSSPDVVSHVVGAGFEPNLASDSRQYVIALKLKTEEGVGELRESFTTVGTAIDTFTVKVNGIGQLNLFLDGATIPRTCSAPSPCTFEVDDDTSVLLEDSALDEWVDDWGAAPCAQTPDNTTCQFTAAARGSRTVTFKPVLILEVSVVGSARVTGEGLSCPPTCEQRKEADSWDASLQSSTPLQWSSPCTVNADLTACNVSLTSTNRLVTVEATSLHTLTITPNADPAYVDSADRRISCGFPNRTLCAAPYAVGDEVTLIAHNDTDSWDVIFGGHPVCASKINFCRFNMPDEAVELWTDDIDVPGVPQLSRTQVKPAPWGWPARSGHVGS
jgi:hypothetical protein